MMPIETIGKAMTKTQKTDNTGEIMMIIFNDSESGTLLLKNPEGTKAWTDRDVRKSVKDGFIKGYDPHFSCRPAFVYSDNVREMRIVTKEYFETEMVKRTKGAEESPKQSVGTGIMFG